MMWCVVVGAGIVGFVAGFVTCILLSGDGGGGSMSDMF